MATYVILFRGINVGGKNKVAMGALRALLDGMGASQVTTYIQSGNVVLRSPLEADALARRIEAALPGAFSLDSAVIKVLALTLAQYEAVIAERPKGFGDTPDTYHSDVIFMMDLAVDKAMTAFSPHEGVDTIWPGHGVIYSRRLSAQRTKTRLNVMMASPLYRSMTIRNWATTLRLLELAQAVEEAD